VDDSQLRNASGAVRFRIRTKEFMPGGPTGSVSLGKAAWMHGAGPSKILHRFYFNRRDNNPEPKNFPNPTKRGISRVVLGRKVNSASLEIESSGTKSYGIHWVDIKGFDVGLVGSGGSA
jgi:hypothetical protein